MEEKGQELTFAMSFQCETYRGDLQRIDLSRVVLSSRAHSFVFNWYQASSKKRINGIYSSATVSKELLQ